MNKVLIFFFALSLSLINSCSHKLNSKENVFRAIANDELIESKYGPEFSFTNDEILSAMRSSADNNNPVNLMWLDRWSEKLKSYVKAITVELIKPLISMGKHIR